MIPCKNEYGSWNSDSQCYVSLKDPQPPKTDPNWGDHTTGAIYACTAVGHGNYAAETVELWLAAPPAAAQPVDFLALATQAEKTLVFNQPTTGRYPSGRLQNGTPYTVVGIPTWFWSDATAWKPLSARAHNGAAYTVVTVQPTALTFTPGDGGAAVECAGPGTVWSDAAYGPYIASPSGCDYRYPHSSIHDRGQVVTATYETTWTPTWTASDGETGTLPVVVTRSSSTFAVAELEAVVTR